jgi:oligopeptide transport system substrate-binding protein
MFRIAAAVFILPMALLLIGLGLERPERRADFVVASDDVRTLDPQRVSWLDEIQVVSAVFEGLTRLEPQTLEPEPGVAVSWTVNETQTQYTFQLRTGARWSNGEPVEAEDFRLAWLRVLDPQVAAQYASLLFVIDGAEAYYRSRLNDDSSDDLPTESVGIAARGKHVLHVRLAVPCPYFLDLTAFPTLFPAHPASLRRFAYRDGRVLRSTQHLLTRPEHIVSNGAFELERWDFRRRLLLKRNPYYWDADRIEPRTIEIFITVARALLAEQRSGKRDDVHIGDRFATFFYRVNCRRPPLDNPALRKALALAVDKVALCEHVTGLGETPTDTFVPRTCVKNMLRRDSRGVYAYKPPDGLGHGLSYAQRVEEARRILREAGLASDGLRPLELAFPPEPQLQRVAEAVQRMWEAALGLRVELRTLERKVLSQRIRELDYDVVRSDWYGDYMDPMTFLDLFVSDSGQNRTGWADAEYDRLIAAASREADGRRRFELFARAERILCEQGLPIIPLYIKRGNFLLRPGFEGLYDNPRDILPIHRVRLRAPQ